MMNSLSDCLFNNDSLNITNVSKRSWKHNVSQDSLQWTPDKKKLKLLSRPKSPQQLDQKSSRRIGLSTRVKKARPDRAGKKSGLCNQITTSHSGEKKHGLNEEGVKLTDSTLPQNTVSPLSTKHTRSSQTESRNLVDKVCEPDLDALKSTLQKAIEGFVECKRMFKETSSNLEHVMGIIKKHLPSVLESAPPIVSQALEDTNSDMHFNREDSLMELDVVLIEKMKILIKEFNSFVLVLETVPESLVIKEILLKEVETREKLFEKDLMKFKENKPWMLTDGIQALDTESQAFIRQRFKNYIEVMDLQMKSMKARRKALTEALQENHNEAQITEQIVREPLSNKTNDSELKIVTLGKNSCPLGNVRSNSSPSLAPPANNSGDNYMGEEDKSVCEEDKTNDINKNKSDKHSTVASKQVWTGNNLPVLDDLVSDESQEDSSSGTLTSESSEADRAHNSPPPADITQDESNDDKIVEALLSEVGPELETDVNCDEEIGSHFLAPQFASVYSPTGSGFMYNIPLKSSQKLGKERSETLINQEHSCLQCQKHFESMESLISHKSLHHIPKICGLCAETFSNGVALTEHVSKCHHSYSVCPECFQAVATRSMADHASKKHESKKAVDHKFKCRACFKIFKSQDEVKQHEKSEKDHQKAFYFCKNCGDLFLTQYELQKHASEKHLAVQLNICKVCFLDFCDVPSLEKHLKLAHNILANKSPRTFGCICCSQDFEQKTELIEHIRLIHQNDDLVEKASQGEDNGILKNKCPQCAVFFKNQKVKAVHEILIHDSAPYTCPCNEAFFNKAKLDEHKLQHTRLEAESMKSETTKSKRRQRMSSMPN